jgi:uncharacterized membrane protein
MRVYVSSALMGIGGIFLSFSSVIFILEIFAARSDTEHRVQDMTRLGLMTLIGGIALLLLGYVLSRIGRRNDDTVVTSRAA